ncbi:MAG: ABC transporter ATP-binding protein [Streptococcus sp.]|nr:ABC transporter ATP-binding protein [Streptococcus sp.]
MEPLLQLHHLSKSYKHHEALNDITLKIPSGKIIGLLGPNGAGKTTLIKILNGLLMPTSGEVIIDGYHPSIETKKIISYLPDTTYLNEHTKISNALDFFEDFYEDFSRKKAEDLLFDLDIDPNSLMKNLSKGNKEKVQLILVMCRQAKLYILDEPIGGVDPAAREYILKTIISNYREDATVIISTHLISDIESILDEAIFLQKGEVVLSGDIDDLRAEYGQSINNIFKEKFRF